MKRARITIVVDYDEDDLDKVRAQVSEAVENLEGHIGNGVLTAPTHELVVDGWEIDGYAEADR